MSTSLDDDNACGVDRRSMSIGSDETCNVDRGSRFLGDDDPCSVERFSRSVGDDNTRRVDRCSRSISEEDPYSIDTCSRSLGDNDIDSLGDGDICRVDMCSRSERNISVPSEASVSCRFYELLHGYITNYGVSESEMNDIQAAVEEGIGRYADIVATIEPMFKAKSIHGVGSFYERTKILKLDEFDFLYVIDELSDNSRVEVEKVFTDEILGLAVKSKDEQYFENAKWSLDSVENGASYLGIMNFLPGRAVLYVRNKQQTFSDVLSEAAKKIIGESLSCVKTTGTLTLLGQENKVGPNVELWFEWIPKKGESFVIKSDITPVIRLSNVSDVVSAEQCEDPDYLARLYSKGSYFVMPSKLRHMQIPYTFSPTFTETERDLMADLDPFHRIAYQCLKFLLIDIYTRRNPLFYDLLAYNKPWAWPNLEFQEVLKKLDYLTSKSFISSYCLKTVILRHYSKCKRQERPDLCGLDIVNTLLDCTTHEPPTLNGIFVNQDNLLWKLAEPDKISEKMLLTKVLGMLKSFHERMLNELSYDSNSTVAGNFRTTFNELINMSEQNGLQAEDDILEFNPMKLSTGSIYNAYKFTKDTRNLLETSAVDPCMKNSLVDNAKLFFQFDGSLLHSTISSSGIEAGLQEIHGQLLGNYEVLPAARPDNDTLSLGEPVNDSLSQKELEKEDDGTVIYSRV